MAKQEEGGLFLLLCAVVLGGLFMFSKWLGCDFMTLLRALPWTLGIGAIAGCAIYFGRIDALLVIAVAMVPIWCSWFPIIDSIALGGASPSEERYGFREQLPAWAAVVKWGGVAVFAGLSAWRASSWRRYW